MTQQRSMPSGEVVREAPPWKLEQPAEIQLHLQRGARANLRHHVLRATTGLAGFVMADLATFALLRALVRAARDGPLGVWLAQGIQRLLPAEYLNAWQLAAALLLGLLVLGNYGQGDRRRDPARLFAACALAAALPLWTALWTRGPGVVFIQFALTAGLMWMAIVAERLTIHRIMAWVRPPERDALDTLFVGAAGACVAAMESPAFAAGTDYRPIGYVDTQAAPAPSAVGPMKDFSVLLAASGARALVVCGDLNQAQFQEVVDTALAAGCQVLSVPRTVEIVGVDPTTVWRHGQPLIQLTAPSFKGWQLAVKRVLDLIGAGVGLLVLSPVFAMLWAMVKLDSHGSVFFGQERVGLGGRPFRMLKFRTMVHGADAAKVSVAHLNQSRDPRLFKVPNDPRVTRIGRWMRRWSLDELPQLWNVLVGQMSLVGPRPFFASDLPLYQAHHLSRLGAKPGVTGLWQVSGRSDIVDFEEVVRLDTRYIREWSLLLDLEILLKTLPAVLRRRGAA